MSDHTPAPYQPPYQPSTTQDWATTATQPAYAVQPFAAPPVPAYAVARPEGSFRFDGGAGSYFLVGLGAALLTAVTLGLALPWAICMQYRWRTQHTIINGRRLRFTGSGGSLFGHWVKWWLLCFVTLGIYSFWVVPRLTRWTVEHQDFT